MDGGRASPLYRHPVREAVEGYTVNRAYWISRIGLYRVYRVYWVYRIRLHDVPQAATINSSMSSSLTTVEPLLPPIPPIPIKEPKESMGLIDFKRVMTLDGKFTGDMAENFHQQSRQAEFTPPW